MLLLLLIIYVLAQSSTVSAGRPVKNFTNCRTYSVGHDDGPVRELFYIDGKLVGKKDFCEALRDYNERDCFHAVQTRNQYCHEFDRLLLLEGAQTLKPAVEEGYHGVDTDKGSINQSAKYSGSLFKPKMLAMAVPAIFLLGCGLLCPCFQAKKRDGDCTAISKEPNSMDILPPMDINNVFERFPGSALGVPPSPSRVPPSPSRVPPSPSRVPPSPSRFSMSPKLNRIGSLHFNVKQISRATQNFSPSMLIGSGGFGDVYKAELPDGRVVAVKRARKENIEALHIQFRTEVDLLAKTDHRNLVKLLDYIEKGDERLIITEYVPNGNLREHLDGLKKKILSFCQRLEIAIDVAHGLTYLHLYAEKQIIHRDVKSSNVLLTDGLRAKVADFGFARLDDDSHIHTKVRGTMGYLDPEYMRSNLLTSKSDVYSFGILLLEILTGRRPVDMDRPLEERVTIKWAFRKYRKGRVAEMLDPRMRERVDEEILMNIFNVVICCAAPKQTDRPDMKTVGELLWGIRMDYLKRKGRLETGAETVSS